MRLLLLSLVQDAICQDLFLNARANVASPPQPTQAQLKMMDMGLSLFMHFSVNPWSSIEHNCVGKSGECIPASVFDPSNLSTDQWVEAAVSMGAGEICLTAHHEGGFCLWDTQYSKYSVMHSPYGKDVVADFVKSCKKYGVKPCYYMGPNANGYLSNNQSYSADAFVEAQLGMLRELLTNYGTDYVSRLWWDHYPSGCGGLAPCPDGSFPDAWPRFVNLVREVSPSTIICPGPDCDGHQGESGIGKYPVWFPCTPSETSGTRLRCEKHAPSATATGFSPYEACATMNSGWFCKGAGESSTNSYWSPRKIWDHYMSSVGIGWVNTLNAPPGTTGQIPPDLVGSMVAFGDALRALLAPAAPALEDSSVTCSGSTPLEIDLGTVTTFNAVVIREDLSHGQRVASYSVDFLDAVDSEWKTFDQLTPKYPFSLPSGHCGSQQDGVNLVSGGPPSTHIVARTDSASACGELCAADPQCNTWTWHDESQGGYAKRCYVRYDTCYDFKKEAGHFSGVCNHTLPVDNRACGGTPVLGLGVHGVSVGARMIDFVPETTATKLRFRCTSLAPDGIAFIKSFSVHAGEPPAGSP
eukprot:TRINITY_DN67676_c0_g1_i1.p1 TRINITY_DN67676_c0_g1~~TRINITY_DN67676_c0_g1_i1.p1  ORF type:complete len:582 (+),score=62.48 TRINITY_DN67676_c0_g1_i1:75-1820(+)